MTDLFNRAPEDGDHCSEHCGICKGLALPQHRGARWTADVMSGESRDDRKKRLEQEGHAA